MLLALSPAAGCAQGSAAPGTACKILRISDGDSLECSLGGQRVRVRLLGIDTPELQQEPWGREARSFLQRLLPVNDVVRLETDVRERDQYRRILAYVWTDSATMVNEAVLRAGYGVPYIVSPNVKHAATLRAASASARDARAGLWAADAFACTPSDFRRGRCR